MGPSSAPASWIPRNIIEALGGASKLHSPRLLREGLRAVVGRVDWEAPDGSLRPVVLKISTDEGLHPAVEWHCLRFLGSLPGVAQVAPELVRYDAEKRFCVLEELGRHTTLDALLRQEEAAAAQRAVEGMGRAFARLHAGTAGLERRFRESEPPLPPEHGRYHEADRWLEALPRVLRWAEAMEMAVPTGFDEACSRIAQVYREPGPFLALTNGDPAPTNTLVCGENVRLVDWEYGAYRHALYDLSAWYSLCPLPAPVTDALCRAYRESWEGAGGPGVSPEEWLEGWNYLCAYRALACLTWPPISTLEENRVAVETWTEREALIVRSGRLHQAARSVPLLAPVAELAAGLHAAFRDRWPEYEDPLPCWPALRMEHA